MRDTEVKFEVGMKPGMTGLHLFYVLTDVEKVNFTSKCNLKALAGVLTSQHMKTRVILNMI